MTPYDSNKGFQTVQEYDLTPKVIKSNTAYNELGLPTPPAGWGRQLPTDEESMEDLYPDLNDSDAEQ